MLAAASCIAISAHAASVGPAGYTNDFSTQPPATDWATYSVAGAKEDITTADALDAAAKAASASVIIAPVINDSGDPPTAGSSATWSSPGRYLQTRPTFNAATLLLCTLTNNLGSAADTAVISYNFNIPTLVAEEVPGHRAYYSLTGATNSWTVIPEFCSAAPGRLTATLNVNWPNNSTLYLLWADDNGTPSPDTTCQIDNFSAIAVSAVPVPAAITAQPQSQTVGEKQSATFAVGVSGNPMPTVQWFTNQTPVPNATNTTFTIHSASLSFNLMTVSAMAENVVSNITHQAMSSNALLTVQADTTAPTVVATAPAANRTVRSLYQMEVLFSKAFAGVDADDLLINGIAANKVDSYGPQDYVFQFPPPAPGPVLFSWRADPGITDLSAHFNAFVTNSWTVTVDTNVAPPLIISEFMASNSGKLTNSIRDEYGAYSDWIEIYNTGPDAADLGGWFLTDDKANPTKFRFPAYTLAGRAYLIVFASSPIKTNLPGYLHTGFALARESSYLALLDPSTNVVSAFDPYPLQYKDVSYGRDKADPAIVGYFPNATPNAANSTSGSGFGPSVRFSKESSTFQVPFDLTLFTEATNAVIRYVIITNSAQANLLPGPTSPQYTGPLAINFGATAQVRARTFVDGLLPGELDLWQRQL